jgi:ribonucleoside-diphosphate reductase alpha chain
MYAWKRGIKTTYYLRSRPATSIAKTTTQKIEKAEVKAAAPNIIMDAKAETKTYTDSEIIACSIDNPEACEACQ